MENEPKVELEEGTTQEIVIPSETSEPSNEETNLDTNETTEEASAEETANENVEAIEVESENDTAVADSTVECAEEKTEETETKNEEESEEKPTEAEPSESAEAETTEETPVEVDTTSAEPTEEQTSEENKEEEKESLMDDTNKEGLISELKKLDTDNTGFLDVDDIKVIISKLFADINVVLEDDELNKKIDSVEKNENGKVNFEELVKSL